MKREHWFILGAAALGAGAIFLARKGKATAASDATNAATRLNNLVAGVPGSGVEGPMTQEQTTSSSQDRVSADVAYFSQQGAEGPMWADASTGAY